MSDLTLVTTPSAWRAQPGETVQEHLHFLHWALCGGPIKEDLASRYMWTERKNVIDSYEALESIPPGEAAFEAALQRVQITFVEIGKLRRRVLEEPDNVLSVGEIMSSIDWVTEKSEAYARARAESMNFESLTPEEREVMLQAKRIQDRLLGKE